MTEQEQLKQNERERFARLTGNSDAWQSIDSLVALCDRDGFWSRDFLATAAGKAKKAHIRRLIRSLPGDDGLPAWASVETTDKDGQTVRVYKQEVLFDVSDYKQVVGYHARQSAHHAKLARTYAKRCKKRFNVSPRLDLHD